MCRMRSVRETAKFFKEMDPETEITETTLRKMIAEGTIPVVKTGVKQLLNLDLLLEMFGICETKKHYGFDTVIEK